MLNQSFNQVKADVDYLGITLQAIDDGGCTDDLLLVENQLIDRLEYLIMFKNHVDEDLSAYSREYNKLIIARRERLEGAGWVDELPF